MVEPVPELLTSNTSSGNWSYGICINSSSKNFLRQNTVDSNGDWGFYITGAPSTDTYYKNIWTGAPNGSAKDSAIFFPVGLV